MFNLAVYVLSYNCSDQFLLWLQNFKNVTRGDIPYKIYLINNSDDSTQKSQYDKLCAQYDIDQIKFDNIGINPGRYAAAQHFSYSQHTHMVFFEDDMILINQNSICKSGFSRRVDSILKKCVNILDLYNLDFIKLSFSEVFGDGFKNWAWINMTEAQRVQYFGSNSEQFSNTRIENIHCHEGTAFATGDFHFCNWPIMCTKEGSNKIFLDPPIVPTYEQTLMVNTFIKMYNKKVRGSCLLASPISHDRRCNYKNRKEY